MNNINVPKSDKKVLIYGFPGCPYCMQVKGIFENDLKIDIDFRNIQENAQYAKEQEELGKQLNFETVPMVFVNNNFLGGCSDVKKLIAENKLNDYLK